MLTNVETLEKRVNYYY